MLSSGKHIQAKKFVGPLSVDDVLQGMRLAIENAALLLSDARRLHDAGRFSTAVALAILSIEESGKIAVLRGMTTDSTDELKRLWKCFRSHRKKNFLWNAPILAEKGARTLAEIREVIQSEQDHTEALDYIKQGALYVDRQEHGWSTPQIVMDSVFSEGIISIAALLLPKLPKKRDLELWKEHVPVGRVDSHEEMKMGLLGWHSAMRAEGLIQDGDTGMIDFLVDPKKQAP